MNRHDRYIHALNKQAERQQRVLSPVNLEVAQVIEAAGLKAMFETREGIKAKTFKVVSAPTGSSKTTSAIAFATAMYQSEPDGFTCAFVVEEIAHAERIYRELIQDLPKDAVGVWSSFHDERSHRASDIGKYQFIPDLTSVDQIRNKPIAVFTHKRWLSEMEHEADHGVRRCNGKLRDVVFVDEQPAVIQILEKSPADILKVRDQVLAVDPSHEWNTILTKVVHTMDAAFASNGNELEAMSLTDDLRSGHFTDDKALAFWREHYGQADSTAFMDSIKFLQAYSLGYCFLSRQGTRGFVAYLPQFKPESNLVILDATADLSGMYPLMGGSTYGGLPQINYSNLSIHHIEAPKVFQRVNAVIRARSRAVAYADWIRTTVMANTKSGDRVLVVLHKGMVETQGLFKHSPMAPESETFPGRSTNIIWWGQGIGSNQYKDCTEVFMFSEFYQPRRATVARTLGAKGQAAEDAPLSKLNQRLTGEFLSVEEGDLLRWTKQLACRGNVRNVSLDGTCGVMRLHTSMAYNRLMANIDRLFPGVNPPSRTLDESDSDNLQVPKRRQSLIDLLSTTDSVQISFKQISDKTGIKSGDIGRELKAPTVSPVVSSYGWSVVPGKQLGISGKGHWMIRNNGLIQ